MLIGDQSYFTFGRNFLQKIVLTGAAGRLGSYLREPLTKLTEELVSTDIVENLGKLYPGERFVKANLENIDEIE